MVRSEEGYPARWWRPLEDGRIECTLCPRLCRLAEGQRGFCYVRRRRGGRMELTTYGRSTGFCVDPIEKKPLYHFLPGTAVLSFGTAGCNLACKFCQNWSISHSRETAALSDEAGPEEIARAAVRLGCASVAATYNDPIVFAEYAIDTARACHEVGVAAVAVTSGYVTDTARAEVFSPFDAVNVDLKAFTDDFYHRVCLSGRGGLPEVQDTLRWLVHESDAWVEITTLLIPGLNDGDEEIAEESRWILRELGPDVPVHFTGFHPDYKLTDRPPTSVATLRRARRIALDVGLRFVYTGNVPDPEGQHTYCPGCGAAVIEREGYVIRGYGLDERGACRACGTRLPGRFQAGPGTWGGGRLPVRLRRA